MEYEIRARADCVLFRMFSFVLKGKLLPCLVSSEIECVCTRADRKSQVGQCIFIQLISGSPWPMNQLNINLTIA